MKPWKFIAVGGVALALAGIVLSSAAVAFYVRIGSPSPRSRTFVIPTSAMAPAIEAGDRVVADPALPIEVGSVVIFTDPSGQHAALVKRVVAIAGQSVDVTGGVLMVDGEREEASFAIGQPTERGPYPLPVTVPAGQVWVMGDDRPNSGDSRYFGPVPVSSVIGVATHRYWPARRFGVIDAQ